MWDDKAKIFDSGSKFIQTMLWCFSVLLWMFQILLHEVVGHVEYCLWRSESNWCNFSGMLDSQDYIEELHRQFQCRLQQRSLRKNIPVIFQQRFEFVFQFLCCIRFRVEVKGSTGCLNKITEMWLVNDFGMKNWTPLMINFISLYLWWWMVQQATQIVYPTTKLSITKIYLLETFSHNF
jgi:hypothetical protein